MEIRKDVNQPRPTGDLKVFALGGLYEVGKNMYILEYKEEILIIDSGILFPEDDLYGIDYIIPDYSYLIQNQHKIRGLFITHGHEDHIGGIPYLLKQVKIPRIFANGFTASLIRKKLEDYPNLKAQIYEFHELERLKFTNFIVSFFRVSHSIPDAFGMCITTPYGDVVTTGDFKIDLTPTGKDADYQKICSMGQKGVLLLLSDSTNAKVKEISTSEKFVADNIKDLFREIKGRIIVATFASNVSRLNQLIESSIENNRKILVTGRSMESVVQIGRDIGYIKAKEENFIDEKTLGDYPNNEITILSTGSQGEPLAALSRIAQGQHKLIKIEKGDTVIFSSSAIPGNAPEIDNVINLLSKQGAEVIVQSSFNDVHASGHASSFEEKLIIKLLRPKYFMPVHGEYYMLKTHAKSAIDCGIGPKNIFILENGTVLVINENGAKVLSQKVPAKAILIDGMDIGGINTAVINERKVLSQTGMLTIIVSLNNNGKTLVRPTIISKGFLFAKDNEDVFTNIEIFTIEYFNNYPISINDNLEEAKEKFKADIGLYIRDICKQNPSIFVIINRTDIEKADLVPGKASPTIDEI
ncbi:ribonuclease J [bacterium]|nr:ribonuclease J [bacterium]